MTMPSSMSNSTEQDVPSARRDTHGTRASECQGNHVGMRQLAVGTTVALSGRSQKNGIQVTRDITLQTVKDGVPAECPLNASCHLRDSRTRISV